MPTSIPRSVREAWGDEAIEDFEQWLRETLREPCRVMNIGGFYRASTYWGAASMRLNKMSPSKAGP